MFGCRLVFVVCFWLSMLFSVVVGCCGVSSFGGVWCYSVLWCVDCGCWLLVVVGGSWVAIVGLLCVGVCCCVCLCVLLCVGMRGCALLFVVVCFGCVVVCCCVLVCVDLQRCALLWFVV